MAFSTIIKQSSRRKFFKQMGTVGLASALPRFYWSHAKPLDNHERVDSEFAADPHFIVYVQIYGAWDVCLAFDPKDRDSVLSNGAKAFDQPYAMSDIKTFAGIPLGPHAEVLGKYADRMTVINGINMEIDNGHTPIIAMTGDLQGGGGSKASLQAMVSYRHPYVRKCLIPHLYASYDGYFCGGGLANKTVAVSAVDSYEILKGSTANSNLIAHSEALTRSTIMLDESSSSRQTMDRYARSLNIAAKLREKISSSGLEISSPDSVEALGDYCGALFRAGGLGSLTWSLGEKYSFDTHSNHYREHPLDKALKDISVFCDRLGAIKLDQTVFGDKSSEHEGCSILDRTTIVVTAEYARTPLLNSYEGEDHNFRTNSVLFLGHKTRPGVFGASGEQKTNLGSVEAHAGLPVDLYTGFPKENGHILRMRDVWAGAGSILGVSLKSEFAQDTQPIRFLGV